MRTPSFPPRQGAAGSRVFRRTRGLFLSRALQCHYRIFPPSKFFPLAPALPAGGAERPSRRIPPCERGDTLPMSSRRTGGMRFPPAPDETPPLRQGAGGLPTPRLPIEAERHEIGSVDSCPNIKVRAEQVFFPHGEKRSPPCEKTGSAAYPSSTHIHSDDRTGAADAFRAHRPAILDAIPLSGLCERPPSPPSNPPPGIRLRYVRIDGKKPGGKRRSPRIALIRDAPYHAYAILGSIISH